MIQSLGRNAIVKPVFKEKTDKILTLKEPEPIYYEVISVGDNNNIAIGDKVYLDKYAPVEVINHEGLYNVKIDFIFAKES